MPVVEATYKCGSHCTSKYMNAKHCQKKSLVNSVCALQPVIDMYMYNVKGIGDGVTTFSAVGFLKFKIERTIIIYKYKLS